MCVKNCCKVGAILYGDSELDITDIILDEYEAFNEMFNYFCNENYALPLYCVAIGHLECLKKISKEPNFMYHADLAVCAIEHDQIECLKFIIEELGDVYIPTKKDEIEIGEKCKDYVINNIYSKTT